MSLVDQNVYCRKQIAGLQEHVRTLTPIPQTSSHTNMSANILDILSEPLSYLYVLFLSTLILVCSISHRHAQKRKKKRGGGGGGVWMPYSVVNDLGRH